MVEAGQKAGRQRDGSKSAVPVDDQPPIGTPWSPRADDRNALLVSERSAVFDRPAVLPQAAAIDPLEGIADPEARAAASFGPSRAWSADLVHCRLLVCGETVRRLPPGLRTNFVSQLGNMALSEMTGRRIAPEPAEISALDWTWPRLIRTESLTLQRILMASAFGASLEAIVKVLGAARVTVGKSTVGRWYLAERRRMAIEWQAEKHAVDASTRRRWHELFDRHGVA